jgi:endonuclease/exonuclease/phosphatase family metal-dependent hydrolase
VRVATYNVRGFREGRDRVVRAVRAIDPDVLLLQETGSRRKLRRFAAATGMSVAGDPWSPLRRRVKNAVLVRRGSSIASARLVRFAGSRRWYPRGAIVVRVGGAIELWALSVHLGLDGRERARQAEALIATIAPLEDAPVIVGGDLNATPDMRAPVRVAAALRDAWVEAGEGVGATFPATAPSARIDYLFVSEELEVRSVGLGSAEEPASDHVPVIAEVAERGPES